MANEVKKFVVGQGKFPMWFNEEAAKGRVKLNYDGNELQTITVFAPTKTLTAKHGDVIMMLKSGLTVVPAEKAVKYGVKNEQK